MFPHANEKSLCDLETGGWDAHKSRPLYGAWIHGLSALLSSVLPQDLWVDWKLTKVLEDQGLENDKHSYDSCVTAGSRISGACGCKVALGLLENGGGGSITAL